MQTTPRLTPTEKLQMEVRRLEAEIRAYEERLTELSSYLSSKKFRCGDDLDGYVHVSDVKSRIENCRTEAGWAEQNAAEAFLHEINLRRFLKKLADPRTCVIDDISGTMVSNAIWALRYHQMEVEEVPAPALKDTEAATVKENLRQLRESKAGHPCQDDVAMIESWFTDTYV